MNIFLFPFAPENLVLRDSFGHPAPRQPAHLRTHVQSGAYLRDSSRLPERRPFITCQVLDSIICKNFQLFLLKNCDTVEGQGDGKLFPYALLIHTGIKSARPHEHGAREHPYLP